MAPHFVRLSLLTLLLNVTPLFALTQPTSTELDIKSTDTTSITRVVETSAVVITETQTFDITTYSQFTGLNSTIYTTTKIPVTLGSSVVTSTYSLEIGPGGVGWTIPKVSAVGKPLPQPSFLPGNAPTIGNLTTSIPSPGTSSTSQSSDGSGSTVSSETAGTSSTSATSSLPGNVSTTGSKSSGTGSSTISTISNGSTSSGATSGSTGSDVASESASLTGTITSAPSNFAQITASGTTFTANDWVTTTGSQHSITIAPFILIGGGRGVSLFNLPSLPNVEFDLPGLPKFHLPCINIFGVHISGDCDSPPVQDDSSSASGSASGNPSTTKSPSNTGSTSGTTTNSSSGCSATQTASNCAVTCISSVSASSSRTSCASYSTTCSQTTTACEATGVTSTIRGSDSCLESPQSSFGPGKSLSCGAKCSPGTPAMSGAISVITSSPDPSNDLRRRAIAGRITMDPLQKRAKASAIASLGGCALQTPAAQPLLLPGWPSINDDIFQPDLKGNMQQRFSVISRYDRATQDGCVFTTTRLKANEFANAPSWKDYGGQSFRGDNNRYSLDHAYEKAGLKEFFGLLVGSPNGPSKLSCNQFNQYFFPGIGNCQINVMQAIWDQLASDKRLYFIAMSQYLNGEAKGKFFPPYPEDFQEEFVHDHTYDINTNPNDWVWENPPPSNKWSARGELMNMMSKFEVVLYGVLEMKSNNMLELIDRTNNGIYYELLAFDNTIRTNPNNIFGNTAAWNAAFPQGIAGAYRDHMTSRVEPQIQAPPKYLDNLFRSRIWNMAARAWSLPGVADGSNAQFGSEWNSLWKQIEDHRSHYYSNTPPPTWDYDFHFSWDISKTKRDPQEHLNNLLLGRADSCSFSINSTLPASVTVNATVTPLPTSGITVPDIPPWTTSSESTDDTTASTSFSLAPSSSTSAPPPPSSTAPPPPACTLHLIYSGGRVPLLTDKDYKCDDGSQPPITTVDGHYRCPNQVDIKLRD